MPDYPDDAQKPPRKSAVRPPFFAPRSPRAPTPPQSPPAPALDAPRRRTSQLFTPPDGARQTSVSTPKPTFASPFVRAPERAASPVPDIVPAVESAEPDPVEAAFDELTAGATASALDAEVIEANPVDADVDAQGVDAGAADAGGADAGAAGTDVFVFDADAADQEPTDALAGLASPAPAPPSLPPFPMFTTDSVTAEMPAIPWDPAVMARSVPLDARREPPMPPSADPVVTPEESDAPASAPTDAARDDDEPHTEPVRDARSSEATAFVTGSDDFRVESLEPEPISLRLTADNEAVRADADIQVIGYAESNRSLEAQTREGEQPTVDGLVFEHTEFDLEMPPSAPALEVENFWAAEPFTAPGASASTTGDAAARGADRSEDDSSVLRDVVDGARGADPRVDDTPPPLTATEQRWTGDELADALAWPDPDVVEADVAGGEAGPDGAATGDITLSGDRAATGSDASARVTTDATVREVNAGDANPEPESAFASGAIPSDASGGSANTSRASTSSASIGSASTDSANASTAYTADVAPPLAGGEPAAAAGREDRSEDAGDHPVAAAMERLAQRIRDGELSLPADTGGESDAAALAAVLAALLRGGSRS